MKRLRAELTLVSLAALLTLPSAAVAQTALPASVVVDRDMTTAAGVADVLAVQHLLASVEDQLLPVRLSETTPAKSALGIAYRIGKWAALDLPQDSFLMVVAHEVFGHGARRCGCDLAQGGRPRLAINQLISLAPFDYLIPSHYRSQGQKSDLVVYDVYDRSPAACAIPVVA